MDPVRFSDLYRRALDDDLSGADLRAFAEEAMICRTLGLRAVSSIHALVKEIEGVLSASKAEKSQGDKGQGPES